MSCKAYPTLADVSHNNYLRGQINLKDQHLGYFCIRIDPAKTFVYSSESRVVGMHLNSPDLWRRSRRSLTEYRAKLEKKQSRQGDHYNTLAYERVMSPFEFTTQCPPERNAEISFWWASRYCCFETCDPIVGGGGGGAGTRRRGKGALGLPGGAGTAQGEAQQQGWPNPLPAAAAFW